MLISLSVANWRSFKEESVFTMLSSKERKDSATLTRLPRPYKARRVLPVAAIYGANASGKTTLFEALRLLKRLVVFGLQVDQAIPVEGYRLDPALAGEPSRFAVEFLKNDVRYRYSVRLSRAYVEEEKLEVMNSRGYETIFARNANGVAFGKGFSDARFEFIALGTRANQLFLHNAVAQNADEFRPAFDWFDRCLAIEGVETHDKPYSGLFFKEGFQDYINKRLLRYNTGADKLSLTPVSRDSIPILPGELDNILLSVPQDVPGTLQLRVELSNTSNVELYIAETGPGVAPEFQKVRLLHKRLDGEFETFELMGESSGTRRLLDLLPLFYDLEATPLNPKDPELVYCIDELNKNFHTALTNDLVKGFIGSCGEGNRHQLIFTTHDLMLMQLDTLRRDEMWFCDKDVEGGSTLICLGNQEKARHDSDLLKNYVKGVYGGYPKFREVHDGQ